MKDKGFVIYADRYVYLGGSIENGCLRLESEIDGGEDFIDSEQYVFLSREETDKLFSICSLDELIELGRREDYGGLVGYLIKNGIEFSVTGF